MSNVVGRVESTIYIYIYMKDNNNTRSFETFLSQTMRESGHRDVFPSSNSKVRVHQKANLEHNIRKEESS